LPIEGIHAKWLLDQIDNPNKSIVSKTDLVAELCAAKEAVLVTIGAGDIGELVQEIKQALVQKNTR
jgi:UDP-N-acetylmuramate--alanine ligase